MKLSKTLFGAALSAAVIFGTPALSAGIKFNIIEAEAPTNNSFLHSRAFDQYGIDHVGFGYVQSADVEGRRDMHHSFWYVYEDSGYKNDFHIRSAGVEIGETSRFDHRSDRACGFLNGDWHHDCHDKAKVERGHYQGSDIKFTSDHGTDAGLGDPGFGIFYDLKGKSPYVFLAFADQGTHYDGDFDDLIVKAKGHVNVVPLPAAGWLLLAGVGGLAAMKRRKKA